jgi:four helix bundle protein
MAATKGPLNDKTLEFSVRIVRLCQFLKGRKESVISRQLIRSGIAIGALVREAQHAESKADFVHKLSIALKEANETGYWLVLLHRTGYLNNRMFESIRQDCEEIISLLVKILKTTKENMSKI